MTEGRGMLFLDMHGEWPWKMTIPSGKEKLRLGLWIRGGRRHSFMISPIFVREKEQSRTIHLGWGVGFGDARTRNTELSQKTRPYSQYRPWVRLLQLQLLKGRGVSGRAGTDLGQSGWVSAGCSPQGREVLSLVQAWANAEFLSDLDTASEDKAPRLHLELYRHS